MSNHDTAIAYIKYKALGGIASLSREVFGNGPMKERLQTGVSWRGVFNPYCSATESKLLRVLIRAFLWRGASVSIGSSDWLPNAERATAHLLYGSSIATGVPGLPPLRRRMAQYEQMETKHG